MYGCIYFAFFTMPPLLCLVYIRSFVAHLHLCKQHLFCLVCVHFPFINKLALMWAVCVRRSCALVYFHCHSICYSAADCQNCAFFVYGSSDVPYAPLFHLEGVIHPAPLCVEGHRVPISLPQQLVTQRWVTGHWRSACCPHTGALFGTLLFVLHKDQEVCQSGKVSEITRPSCVFKQTINQTKVISRTVWSQQEEEERHPLSIAGFHRQFL